MKNKIVKEVEELIKKLDKISNEAKKDNVYISIDADSERNHLNLYIRKHVKSVLANYNTSF